MQLQAVVDTAAQVTLVSEEFYKSLDPAPPIRKEVVMNTAGKGMQMNGYIAGPFQVVLGTHLFTVEIPLARNTPASFSLTKGLPVPKLMGITSPDICSSFSLRCRDTPLASKKSKPSNI
jgi:hypothetical protein